MPTIEERLSALEKQARPSIRVLIVGENLPQAEIASRLAQAGVQYATATPGAPAYLAPDELVVVTDRRLLLDQVIAQYPGARMSIWAATSTPAEREADAWRKRPGRGWITLATDLGSRLSDSATLAGALTARYVPVVTTQAVAAQREGLSASSQTDVESAIIDMAGTNDLVLRGLDPVSGPGFGRRGGRGNVIMGIDNRGWHQPLWSGSAIIARDQTWTKTTPWFVLYEGQDNAVRGAVIEVAELRAAIRIGNVWQRRCDGRIGRYIAPGQSSNYTSGPSVDVNASRVAIRHVTGTNAHGFVPVSGQFQQPGVDAGVQGLYSEVWMRLAPGSEDALFSGNCGCDYEPVWHEHYPWPSAMQGRTKRITPQWQRFTATTLRDAGNQDPGGGMSVEEFRRNPPPFGDMPT